MVEASLLFDSDVVIHNIMHRFNKSQANVDASIFPSSLEFDRNFHHEVNVC